MLRAKLVEIAGGGELQTKEFVEAKVEIANLVGVQATQVIMKEVLAIMKSQYLVGLPEPREGPKYEQSKPKAPRDKVSSDKRAKGPSSQRKGYG